MALGLRRDAESTPRILVKDAEDRAALAAVSYFPRKKSKLPLQGQCTAKRCDCKY